MLRSIVELCKPVFVIMWQYPFSSIIGIRSDVAVFTELEDGATCRIL